MTSSQQAMPAFVFTAAAAVLTGLSGGCASQDRHGPDPLVSPYAQPRVWAVAPFRNESGTIHADGLLLADHIARHLSNASNIEMMPLNRTLAAMESLGMPAVSSPDDARQLLVTLGADAIILGSVTAYDPWDPPKLGLIVELYDGGGSIAVDDLNVRLLTRAATDEQTHPSQAARSVRREPGVAGSVSAMLDAADADVRSMLRLYGGDRTGDGMFGPEDNWVRYRISMDLYSEFVTYVMSWRLLRAEAQRLSPPVTTDTPRASR